MEIFFRPLIKEDWPVVAEIYRQGIETGNATFEKKIPEWTTWNSAHHQKCRLIAMADGKIAGWAALVPISGRTVYSGVAEVSIYISSEFRGSGIGRRLLIKLVEESETEGFWTLQASVFPENAASIKIHQEAGFRKVGFREKIGNMDGTWRDTVLLERRSKVTGK